MKNFLSILLVIVFTCIPMCSQAKNNEAKCVITMLDGKKVSGTIVDTSDKKYGAYNVKNLYSVKIKDDNGNETEITADDASEMIITHEDGSKSEYMSLYTIKNFTLPKSMKKSAHRYFWYVFEKNKNLISFASVSTTYTLTGVNSSVTTNSAAFSYCKKGDDIAVTYYVPTWGTQISLKAEIRRAFDRFPKMADYIESDKFNMNELKKNPFNLIKVLDAYI